MFYKKSVFCDLCQTFRYFLPLTAYRFTSLLDYRSSMFSLNCRVTRDEDHKQVVGESEREQIIQEFLNRKREAEANKARVAQDRREPSQAPWAVNDWNYKINPNKNG